LNHALDETHKRIAELESAAEKERTEKNILQEENRSLNALLQKRSEELREELLRDMKVQIDRLSEAIASKDDQIRKITESLKDVTNENVALKQSLESQKEENEKLRKKVTEYEGVIDFFKKSRGGVLIK
jgi:chromosome segregation ATPase